MAAPAFVLAGALALTGCSRPAPPETFVSERCVPVSGEQPATLDWIAPKHGTMRVTLRQRGVSVIGALRVGGDKVWASSIVDRFGDIALTADVDAHEPMWLEIKSRDSREIAGEVCVSADLLNPADQARLLAERQFAAAGRDVLERDWHRAVRHYAAAARGFERSDPERAAAARHALSQLAYGQFDRDRDSAALAASALLLFGPQADAALRSNLVFMQARALLRMPTTEPAQHHARVLELLDDAQELALQAAPSGARMIPRIETLRGFIRYNANDARSAADYFDKAALQCKSMQDWECYARARQNLAALAEESRGYTAALEAYADAINHLKPNVAPELVADIWTNFGRLQGTVGLFTRGEKSYLQAIQLFAQIHECDGARRGLARLGSMLVQVGSVGDAISYLSRAATLSCPDLMGIARDAAGQQPTSIAMVASNERTAGVTADTPLLEASCANAYGKEHLTDEGRFGVFLGLLGLSDAAMLERRPEAARRCLTAAQPYAIDLRTELRLANAAGMERLASGEFTQATAEFRRAQRVADRASLPKTYEYRGLTQLGLARSALLAGATDVARREANEALQLSSARADINQVAASLQVLAQSMRKDDPALAARTLQLAAQLMERVPIDGLDAEKRAIYLATQHAVFAELTDLFVAEVANDESAAWTAFEMVERGRARSVRHAVGQVRNDASQSATATEDEYQQLLRSIGALVRQDRTGQTWTSTLERLSALLGEREPAPTELSRDELLSQLARLDATLVEYAAGTREMFAFVIEAGHIRVVPLGELQEIERATSELHSRLRNAETAASDVRVASRRLAELALWPISPLVTKRRIVFVPDDAMHTVPLSVLPWGSSAPEHLVIHQAETAIMPSAAHVMHASPEWAKTLTAPRFELIGDPVFRAAEWRRECVDGEAVATYSRVSVDRSNAGWAEGLPRLAGARAEVESIAELARVSRPAGRIGIRLGCGATPTALRTAVASHADLLHIATHGYVDALRPRLSALALTRDADKDATSSAFGLLEILQMPVSSRLVVLSACDTSRGRLLPGEGVLGPAQAFLQAGAASVVASYWRVDDAETAVFMRSFYQHLLVDRLPVAAALRQTQIESAARGSVHTWAAFALYGQPDAAL